MSDKGEILVDTVGERDWLEEPLNAIKAQKTMSWKNKKTMFPQNKNY